MGYAGCAWALGGCVLQEQRGGAGAFRSDVTDADVGPSTTYSAQHRGAGSRTADIAPEPAVGQVCDGEVRLVSARRGNELEGS